MMSKLQTHYFHVMPLLLITLLLAQLLTVTTAQASTLDAALQQKDPACRISVPSGWRPYRVQSADNLEGLAMQASIGLEMAMQVNCLTTAAIKADDLLILPALTNVTTPVQVVEENRVESAAPATGETAPAVAAQPLLTVISTTATMATSAVAAPAALVASKLPERELAAPASSLTSANLIAIALFVLGGLGVFFFALRPRSDDSAVVRSLFNTVGNAIFLFAGVLIGVILFPMMHAPSFTELPTGVSVSIAVTLIGLLVAKELFFSGQQWRTMNRLLNLGIAPLLMIFFLTVATRVAEMIN